MSRCTIDAACAAESADAAWIVMSRISRSVSGTAGDALAQRLAVDEFGHQEARAVVIADLVNRQDVRVIERRRRPRFVQETAQSFRIAAQLRPQYLERDRSPERRVDGLVDLAHPAGAEQAQDLVTADGAARGQGHRRGLYRVIPREGAQSKNLRRSVVWRKLHRLARGTNFHHRRLILLQPWC